MLLNQFDLLSPEEQEAILDGPALSPPPGVTPNLESPPNQNAAGLVAIALTMAAGTIAISLRGYSRVFITRKLFLEDLLAFAAYVLLIASQCMGFRFINSAGMFVHQWDIRMRDLSEFLWVTTLCLAFYSIVIMNLKVAILLEWKRTFVPSGTRGFFFWTCYFLIFINILFYTSAFIVVNLSCTPHKKMWDQTVPGKCFDRKAVDVSSASINIASHILILVLPHTVIWKLNMTTKKKINVSLVFAIGVLALLSGIFRLVATVQYFQTQDATYAISRMAVWCGAEMVFVLFVFCAPTFPNVFHDMKLSLGLFTPWSKYFKSLPHNDNRDGKARSSHILPKFNQLSYKRINEDTIPPQDSAFQRRASLASPVPYNDPLSTPLELHTLRTIRGGATG
ncbi:hypothetical protein F4774DRAFT_423425 [Daldinia eschscholtzii]|nr:hypothetical protein F4774DRAFT_423425 [Daldinia eschscholtzii]